MSTRLRKLASTNMGYLYQEKKNQLNNREKFQQLQQLIKFKVMKIIINHKLYTEFGHDYIVIISFVSVLTVVNMLSTYLQ